MKEIPLTQGKVALVDDEDYDRVAALSWYAAQDKKSGTWYAQRHEYPTRSGITVRMSRFILGAPNHLLVDHVDRDGLNNQKSNIRVCNKAQNCRNKIVRNKLGFRGVRWEFGRFSARIGMGRKRVRVGMFHTAKEAALAYDAAARLHYGEFARLNFPCHGEQSASNCA